MASTTTDRTRRYLAAATLLIPLLGVAVTAYLWRARLPAQVASHWSGAGAADDTLPTTGVLIGAFVVTGVAAVAGFIAARSSFSALAARTVFLAAGLLAGMAAGAWIIPTALTIQAGDALEAVLGGWIVALLALAAYGLIPFLISPRPTTTGLEPRERAPFEASESTEFATTITGIFFLWVALGIAALGVALFSVSAARGEAVEPVGIAVLVLVVVLLVSFARVRITIDARGLRVVSAVLPIPFKRIPLHKIDSVEATELAPLEWGGWGYRIMPGRSALILRKGPGLVIGTTGGKLFAVSLRDPDAPARLLASLRDDGPPASVPAGGRP